jgi:hypothetical protein
MVERQSELDARLLPSTNKLSPDRRMFDFVSRIDCCRAWSSMGSSSGRHFVEREREARSAFAVSERGVPTQLANESFRTSHVCFGNFVGAVAQVPMRGDFPAPEAFLYDHIVTPFWNGGEVRMPFR